MGNEEFINLLAETGACNNATNWAHEHGGTPAELWRDCERGDWMGWILGNLELYESPQKLAACLADVIRKSAKLLPEAQTVEKTLRLYARGKATIEDVEVAGRAAEAASLKKSAAILRKHYPLF